MTMYYIYTVKIDMKIFSIILLTVCSLLSIDFVMIVTLVLTGPLAPYYIEDFFKNAFKILSKVV